MIRVFQMRCANRWSNSTDADSTCFNTKSTNSFKDGLILHSPPNLWTKSVSSFLLSIRSCNLNSKTVSRGTRDWMVRITSRQTSLGRKGSNRMGKLHPKILMQSKCQSTAHSELTTSTFTKGSLATRRSATAQLRNSLVGRNGCQWPTASMYLHKHRSTSKSTGWGPSRSRKPTLRG